jgi:O-antigen/teichoic acid export membrane protein
MILGRPRWTFDGSIWRLLWREAGTFAGMAIFSTIHMNIGQIMLSKLHSVESVGIFSAADRLVDVCRTFPVAFSAALLPFFTKEYITGVDRLRQIAVYSLRYVFIGACPVVIGTAVLADQFIALIYGGKFFAAGPVLRLYIFCLIPFSMVYILAQVLVATDNQRVDLMINIVAAVMNFVLNFLLIPVFAEIGAALAALITIIVFNHLQCIYTGKYLFSIPYLDIFPKALFAALGMGIVTYALQGWNLFGNVALSACVYAALLWLLRALSPEEMGFLKRVIRSRKNEGNI